MQSSHWLVHVQHRSPLATDAEDCIIVHSQATRLAAPAGAFVSSPVSSTRTGVESWSVINDQDAVARGGKFMGLFKRAGDRIFLSQKGDMLVCPIFLEAAVWRKRGSTNVRHHMMAAYLKVRVQQLLACHSLMTAGP